MRGSDSLFCDLMAVRDGIFDNRQAWRPTIKFSQGKIFIVFVLRNRLINSSASTVITFCRSLAHTVKTDRRSDQFYYLIGFAQYYVLKSQTCFSMPVPICDPFAGPIHPKLRRASHHKERQ